MLDWREEYGWWHLGHVGRMPDIRQHIGGSSSPGPSFLAIAFGELFSGVPQSLRGLFSCPQPRAPSHVAGTCPMAAVYVIFNAAGLDLLIDVYAARGHPLDGATRRPQSSTTRSNALAPALGLSKQLFILMVGVALDGTLLWTENRSADG
jgi:hypothetical protein